MNHCTKEELITFESRIRDAWEAGELQMLLHLCGGNEDQLIEIFREIEEGDWIFSSHRSHYHYLLAGGDPSSLERMIHEGRSMFIFDRKLNFLTSSVLAGTCGMAAGVAWAIREEGRRPEDRGQRTEDRGQKSERSARVWCFLGDGAEEEGHFYEAVLLVHGHGLPCTFIIEDNDRSVDTDKVGRRGEFCHLPVLSLPCIRRYHYDPTYPHAGSGCKHHILFKN